MGMDELFCPACGFVEGHAKACRAKENEMDVGQAREAIDTRVGAFRTSKRSVIRAFASRRMYRLKWRFVVGYQWCRPYSHHMSGKVYECIVGWGNSYEEAVAMFMRKWEEVRK